MGPYKVVFSTDRTVAADIHKLHKVVFINRMTIATKEEKNKPRVDQMKFVIIDDYLKKTMSETGMRHERSIRLGGLKPRTSRLRQAQAASNDPREIMEQKIGSHCDEVNETLYRVLWFDFSAEDDTW